MRATAPTFLLAVLLLVSGVVSAAPITIVSQADNWDYNFGPGLGTAGAGTVTFADFTVGYTGVNNGPAPFGNTNVLGAPWQTFWNIHTALYAQKTVNLSGPLTGNATLNVAVDNGAAVWVNGNLAFQQTAGGFTNIWEYSTSVSSAFFNNGPNTISVLANDWGGATYFDMELLGDISSAQVPEPAMYGLFGLGLLGLAFARRRKA